MRARRVGEDTGSERDCVEMRAGREDECADTKRVGDNVEAGCEGDEIEAVRDGDESAARREWDEVAARREGEELEARREGDET